MEDKEQLAMPETKRISEARSSLLIHLCHGGGQAFRPLVIAMTEVEVE